MEVEGEVRKAVKQIEINKNIRSNKREKQERSEQRNKRSKNKKIMEKPKVIRQ